MTLRELVNMLTKGNADTPTWDYSIVLVNGSECVEYCSCTIETDRVFAYTDKDKQVIGLTEDSGV